MERKVAQFIPIKGINRDIGNTKSSSNTAYDILNFRINSNEDSGLFELTNERASVECLMQKNEKLYGRPIGYCVVDKYIVLFTCSTTTSYIYRIENKVDINYEYKLLYSGNLGFNEFDPIQTLGSYENDKHIKVYWVDGAHQPRMIDILSNRKYTDTSFDFSQNIQFIDDISVSKNDSGGKFHSGTIQYAFSYWNMNGQESNIFKSTPIYYISNKDRAGNLEEICESSFTINIKDLDSTFDYIRIYSVLRTSLDAAPLCKVVSDIKIPSNIHDSASVLTVTDNGIIGRDISPTAMLFIGGDELVIGTIASKDNTMFAGDISIKRPSMESIKGLLKPGYDYVYNGSFYRNTDGWDLVNAVRLPTNTDWSVISPSFNHNHDFEFMNDEREPSTLIDSTSVDSTNYFDVPSAGSIIIDNSQGSSLIYNNNNDVVFSSSISDTLYLYKDDVIVRSGFKFGDKIEVIASGQYKLVIRTEAHVSFRKEGNISATIMAGYQEISFSPLSIDEYQVRLDGTTSESRITQRAILTPSAKYLLEFDSICESDTSAFTNSAIGSINIVNGHNSIIFNATSRDFSIWCNPTKPGNFRINNVKVTDSESAVTLDWVSRPGIDSYDILPNMEDTPSPYNGVYKYKPYTLDLQSNLSRHFKKGENYRFGIQCQYANGKWSEPLYIGRDFKMTKGYSVIEKTDTAGKPYSSINYHVGELTLSNDILSKIKLLGYKKIRPVYVPLTQQNRTIVAQGFITNTIANVVNRSLNSPFAIPDYFTRPNTELLSNISPVNSTDGYIALPLETKPFATLSCVGLKTVGSGTARYEEIGYTSGIQINTVDNVADAIHKTSNNDVAIDAAINAYKKDYFIDSNLVNLWTPEIYDDSIRNNISNCESILFRGISYITGSAVTNKQMLVSGESSNQTSYVFNNTDYKSCYAILNDKTIDGVSFNIFGRKKYSDTIEYTNKIVNRYLFSNHNDMLIDNVELKYDIYQPKYIDKDTSVYTYTQNQLDGSSGSIVYQTLVDEINAETKSETTVINYKPGNHILMALKSSLSYDKLIPRINLGSGGSNMQTQFPIGLAGNVWYRRSSTSRGFSCELLLSDTYFGKPVSSLKKLSYVWIVDLCRSLDNKDGTFSSQYGGQLVSGNNRVATEESLLSNIWIQCGEPVFIDKVINKLEKIIISEGDTFIQRYDVMRTTPRKNTDWQKVSEVVSVLCESFVNIDGRYDTHRYETDIQNLSDSNFGLVNKVYSQYNNYFKYSTLNYDLLSADNMPSAFAITNEKQLGGYTDEWTNIQLATTTQVNGSLGRITYLDNINDTIIGWQPSGVFRIMFNSRVQIAASDNIPIEIANSKKLDGVKYISTCDGCSSKLAVGKTTNFVYFHDVLNKKISILGEQIENLTEKMGMNSWIRTFDEVTMASILYAGLRIYTDVSTGNVYFATGPRTMCYSERLQAFESTFSYNELMLFNHRDHFIGLELALIDNKTKDITILKHMSEGDYSTNCALSFYVNQEPHKDKVFDSIQYRADVFVDSEISNETFNTLRVSNEYQDATLDIMNASTKALSRSVNHRFRSWSMSIPRHLNNRIRNPWCKIELSYLGDISKLSNNKIVFHDLLISYSV